MSENVKMSCSCDTGFDKGALKKTIENNIFTIFGNMVENNSIVIRYHGLLSDNPDTNSFSIVYYFDSEIENKRELTLTKCTKCEGQCYCGAIDLKSHSKMFFVFKNEEGQLEQNGENIFELCILKDPISSIMQRYGFEANTNLPIEKDSLSKHENHFKNIIESIKLFFLTCFTKKTKG